MTADAGATQRDRFEVGPEDAGERIDVFLASRLGSRSRAQKLIAAGAVLINGREPSKRESLTAGTVIEVDQPKRAPAGALVDHDAVTIVYQDDDVLVVDKAAGVVVHPAPGHHGTTLVELLAGSIGGGPDTRPGVVHRLDRDTSGLLILAKHDEALRHLQRQLEAREVDRRYLALVDGTPPARTGTIDAPIGRDPRDRTRMSVDGESPREAVTHFETLEHLHATTYLKVRLQTGRTHQIRVHLAAIGHPVVGDPTYGESPFFGLERQWLHAAELRFEHPRTGELIELTSELPPELVAALASARESG